MTRAIIAVVAFLAPQHRNRPEFPWWPDNPLIRWDAGHYRRILIRGYPPVIDDTTAFFPLYPVVTWPAWKAIVWADTAITGRAHDGSPEAPENVWASEWALIVVTHVASLLAVVVFFRWCRGLAGDGAALRACLLLCAFPAAMYFSVAYADGVFLLLLALMLLLSQRGRPWLAAICCGAATAARPTGIAAAVVLFFLTWRQFAVSDAASRASPAKHSLRTDRTGRIRRLLRLVPLGVVSISGLLLHEGYLWSYYGRPDAYFAAQKSWALPDSFRTDWVKTLSLQPVLEPAIKPIKYAARGEFSKLTDARNWNRFINVVMVAAAICALFRPGPVPRAALWLTILVFLIAWSDDPFTGGRMLGITRYHLMGLPCFLWLAMRRPLARSRIVFGLLLAGMLLLQCFYIAGYVDWILVS